MASKIVNSRGIVIKVGYTYQFLIVTQSGTRVIEREVTEILDENAVRVKTDFPHLNGDTFWAANCIKGPVL